MPFKTQKAPPNPPRKPWMKILWAIKSYVYSAVVRETDCALFGLYHITKPLQPNMLKTPEGRKHIECGYIMLRHIFGQPVLTIFVPPSFNAKIVITDGKPMAWPLEADFAARKERRPNFLF